ncbi:MAG: hypothetical protein U5L09_06175 [Bacteroidales bacterium]|nr:hypothetical protein [Bacteroidales bacterium]
MKKQFLLMLVIVLTALVYTSCSKDDKKDEENNEQAEIAVSDYPAYFPGAWQDSYATRHYCTDNTFYIDFDNGNSAEGTWDLSGDELTMNYSSGETYVYVFEYMLENEYKIVDQESGSEFNATLANKDGCYWLDVDEYDDYMPGRWKYTDNDGEEDTYWLCDDNTFHFESTKWPDDYGTWSVDGENLIFDWSKGIGEKAVTYDIDKMRPDYLLMHRGEWEYEWNRISSDGCYVAPEGSVVFFLTEDCGCGEVTVSINGVEQGTISSYFSGGDVDCGTDGALTIDLEPGTYDVYAECQGLYWEFTTTVTDGGCAQEELSCSKAFAK